VRGWGQPPETHIEETPRGFDDFDLRLGDIMRGERATMGRSLLDVQRELKIKATYIAAIENADISAFEAPGFVAGYVRSYARYLGLDPEWAYETFCAEAGFVPAGGLAAVGPKVAGKAAGGPDATRRGPVRGPVFRADRTGRAGSETARDPIAQPRVSFAPETPGLFSGLQPRAIGPTLVLLLLIAGLGYGSWSLLREVQKVTLAPVERSPEAVAQIDPLDSVAFATSEEAPAIAQGSRAALDRLYRPQPLETPRMVPRDGPIAQLDPRAVGTFAGLDGAGGDTGGRTPPVAPATAPDPFAQQISRALATLEPSADGPAGAGTGPGAPASAPGVTAVVSGLGGALGPPLGAAETPFAASPGRSADAPARAPRSAAPPQVTENMPEVVLLAVEPAWVRVRAAGGAVLLERVMQPGESWAVPTTDLPPTLRTGAAGGVFFAVNGVTRGPAGAAGAVVDGIALAPDPLSRSFAQVDPEAGAAAREAVAVADAALSRLSPGPLGPTGGAPDR